MLKRRKLSNKFLTVLLFPITIVILMLINYMYSSPSHQAYSQNQYFNKTPTSAGIDVSEHQKEIDWQSINTNQIDFAIIRTGYGYAEDGAIDNYFYENIKNAQALGLKVGVYHYSYAVTVEEARKEAEFVLSIMADIHIDLPIYFDFEDPVHDTLTPKQMDNITKAFLEVIEQGGYKTGIYANSSRLSYLSSDLLEEHDIWIASYGDTPNYYGDIKMWQYTNQGKIDGISTYVDLNYGYY